MRHKESSDEPDKAVLTASNIIDSIPNSTITQVECYCIDSSGTKVTLGTVTQGSGGSWNAAVTVNLPPGSYTLFAQAQDDAGVFSDPLALTLQVL